MTLTAKRLHLNNVNAHTKSISLSCVCDPVMLVPIKKAFSFYFLGCLFQGARDE